MKLPIIFLHGFLGAPSDWNEVIQHLPSYTCFTPSLPGHGNTPFSPSLELPNLPRFHLVGYSMGGRIALQYAEEFPDKIASLTLASCHFGLATEEEKQKRWHIDQIWANKLKTLPLSQFLLEWYEQPLFSGFMPDLTQRLCHDPHELAKALLHYSLSLQKKIENTQAHVLVGERDLRYRALFPNGFIIPKAAHMVHLENPSAFAKYLLSILESTP